MAAGRSKIKATRKRVKARAPRAESAPADAEPGRREIRRRERHELSRRQVLEAAEAVFAAKGFQEATVREIADLAEFSVGAVYSFFEGKDEIFAQIMKLRGGEFAEGTRALLGREQPALEQLHRLADFQIQFFREHRNFARIWLRSSMVSLETIGSALRDPNATDAWEPLRLQRELFVRGQAFGEIRAGDPNVLAMLFTGLVYAYQSTDALVLEDREQPERLPLAIFHQVLDGAFKR
jgi:TetR/AcrR family transcriptional regulator